MDIRHITQTYAVTPQITVQDVQAIADAGFSLIICNRPDEEVTPDLFADTIRAEAEAKGLRFESLPLSQETLNPDNAARQRALLEGAEGPVLAYCRSGTRCSVIWALGHAPDHAADEILQKTAAAGYALDHMRPVLRSLSQG
jgi:uncharacterized protein (TIGR01244 family)